MTGSDTAAPAPTAAPSWHALDVTATLTHLGSTETGLTDEARATARARHGSNSVVGRRREPWWRELAESFTEPLQLLLVAVAVLSAVFGEISDALAIAVVIIAVAVVETVTELRAARSIAALQALTAPTARLVRDTPATGAGVTEVAAAELVPGDVIAVAAGDLVPADARVLTAHGLRVDESSMTGEAAPVGKGPTPVPEATELAERTSMIYAGAAVVGGDARAVVVATGAATQLGQLGALVTDTTEPPTPLQRALSQLARAVLGIALAASALVIAVGLAAGQPGREMLLAGLTVAFATIPEELPILVVVLLAVGGLQLARRGALLRRLQAGETLGEVTTVITDKTGTLTENRMRLTEVTGERDHVLDIAVHAQPADSTSREPMDAALADAAHRAGITQRGEPLAWFPFDPTRKLVSQAWQVGPHVRLAVSGAPEAVLHRCLLTPGQRAHVAAQLDEFTGRGLRVIGFATRLLPDPPIDREDAETGLSFVGLAAFTDPLRVGVPAAVAALTAAGVSTIMVTGDHPATAAAVATQAGLPAGTVLTGAGELDAHNDTELAGLLRHGTVVARATPQIKHRLVQLLQRRGDIVAVTGDGANDAPALAAADVGIAMGRRGADLARQAADLVLTDDSYSTVTAAIAKGRNISAQLRRAIAFYLGAKLALVTVVLAALALGRPVPFVPIHIVLLEIFMDLGASVAFVAEPGAPTAMRRPPRPPGARFLDRATVGAIAVVALTLTAATLPVYLLTAPIGSMGEGGVEDTARAAAVLAWLAGHALIAWTLRSQPALSWVANPAFPAWVGAALAAGLVVVLTPLAGLVDLAVLPPPALATVAICVVLAVAAAAVAGRALHLDPKL